MFLESWILFIFTEETLIIKEHNSVNVQWERQTTNFPTESGKNSRGNYSSSLFIYFFISEKLVGRGRETA
jgi:hypothetical protein